MGGEPGEESERKTEGGEKERITDRKKTMIKKRQTDTKTRKGINPDDQKDIYGYRMGRKRRYIRNKSRKGRR